MPTRPAPNVHVTDEIVQTAEEITRFLRDGVSSVNIVIENEYVAPGPRCHYADELLRVLDAKAIRPERFHISYPRHRGNNSFVIVITREVVDKSIPASAA